MAITALNQEIWIPTMPEWQTGGTIGSITSVLLNAASDKCAFVFRVPKTGTLDKAEWYLNAVSNNPDNGLRVSFQDVDVATGLPDGTQDQYRDITGALSAATWQVPGLMTSDGTDTGTKRSVTIGDRLAIVIEFVSFVASDSVGIGVLSLPSNFMQTLSAWVGDASTGTYTKATATGPIFALKYDDGTYAIPGGPMGVLPISGLTSTSYNTGSTPDEYAARLSLPIKARAIGAWARVDANEAFDLVLYDGTTAQRTISFNSVADVKSTIPGMHFGYFSSSFDLTAAAAYRIAIKPTTATSIQVYRFSMNSTAIMATWGGGADWYESSRVDAGAWSDTTTNKVWAGLIIDGFDVSGGGGGGTRGYMG